MSRFLKSATKGAKYVMDKAAEVCREVLSSDKNKLTFGLILIGVGAALVASIYIRVPQ